MYEISNYSKRRAKSLGVKIRPSQKAGKKIDVFDWNGQYITSIGALAYDDYPKYLKTMGKEYAEERRRLYYLRHKDDIENIGSRGYYAAKILW